MNDLEASQAADSSPRRPHLTDGSRLWGKYVFIISEFLFISLITTMALHKLDGPRNNFG